MCTQNASYGIDALSAINTFLQTTSIHTLGMGYFLLLTVLNNILVSNNLYSTNSPPITSLERQGNVFSGLGTSDIRALRFLAGHDRRTSRV